MAYGQGNPTPTGGAGGTVPISESAQRKIAELAERGSPQDVEWFLIHLNPETFTQLIRDLKAGETTCMAVKGRYLASVHTPANVAGGST